MRASARANDKIEVLSNRDVSIPDWIVIGTAGAPAFFGTWTAFGGTEDSPRFWRDSAGIVHLAGLAKNGSIGTGIFTLPVGFRPSNSRRLPVVSAGVFGYVTVDGAGIVTATAGSATYIDLSGASFRAEQ